MKTFAHVKNGVVANISAWADDAELPESHVDVTGMDVGPGDLYDGQVFTRPAPDPVARTITADHFRDRFTVEEMDAVLALAYGGDAIARRLLLKLQTQSVINLGSAELLAGLDYLVTTGAITEARKVEVLA